MKVCHDPHGPYGYSYLHLSAPVYTETTDIGLVHSVVCLLSFPAFADINCAYWRPRLIWSGWLVTSRRFTCLQIVTLPSALPF